jgi:hypothetical protein
LLFAFHFRSTDKPTNQTDQCSKTKKQNPLRTFIGVIVIATGKKTAKIRSELLE